MATLITKEGHTKLSNILLKLRTEDLAEALKTVESLRPFGIVSDSSQEFLLAKENKERIENKIAEYQNILSNCVIYDSSMAIPNVVGFGSTVTFVNEDNIKKTYRIVSIYESDINQGLISIEAPLVKEMIGKSIGDTFDYNDKEYVIENIIK